MNNLDEAVYLEGAIYWDRGGGRMKLAIITNDQFNGVVLSELAKDI